jgi:selenocysteine lyase/cysteine desulfurase
MAVHDYPHMLAQFRLMARRYGMANRLVTVPLDPKSDKEVVTVYADAITPRTRLLMVCHMINITGHILPVRKIAGTAHARGVQVMVDGAHTFAQLNPRWRRLRSQSHDRDRSYSMTSSLPAMAAWSRFRDIIRAADAGSRGDQT